MGNNDTDDVYDAVMECFKVLGQPLSVYSHDEVRNYKPILKEKG